MEAIHQPYEVRSVNGGTQRRYKFANGYGASAVCHAYSYGGDEGKWEVAVIGPDGSVDSTTPVTNDVIGWLEESEINGVLEQIAALEQAP